MTDSPVLTRDLLIASFEAYGQPPARWRVGGEFERVVVRRDGAPVPYEGPAGIRAILEHLRAVDPSWAPVFEGEALIALEKPSGASITLEPGGQVELSGAPHRSLRDLAAELQENRDQLVAFAEGRDLLFLSAGLSPLARIDDIPWMPKGRYRIMREYLPQVGDLAHWMMKATASVQANYDYADEADAARKVRLAAGIAPILTGLFSHSPVAEGRLTGFKTFRGHIWTRTDPARTGFPAPLKDGFTFEKHVDLLLDVPMMFTKIDGRWAPAGGRTFRQWMAAGIDGRFPTWDDWALHQTSVFPEVRIKRTIEIRGADAAPVPLAVAFCGFYAGLFYDAAAADGALALVDALGAAGEAREAQFDAATRLGMEATVAGRPLRDWARELGTLAHAGLSRWSPGEQFVLEPLLERLESGRSLADDVLEAVARDPSPAALLRAVAY